MDTSFMRILGLWGLGCSSVGKGDRDGELFACKVGCLRGGDVYANGGLDVGRCEVVGRHDCGWRREGLSDKKNETINTRQETDPKDA